MSYGLIVGTGFKQLNLPIIEQQTIATPYGPAEIYQSQINCQPIIIIPRHGINHNIAPHLVNYQANIWALASLAVSNIIAVAAVGSINSNISPQTIIIPDQLIDYTFNRAHTFSDSSQIIYAEFSQPYSNSLRNKIISAGNQINIKLVTTATYGITQGSRLETKAEIKKMYQDGCDMVGMTGMPEAILAREKNLNYATVAVSVNWAAGVNNSQLDMQEINNNLNLTMAVLQRLLNALVKNKENQSADAR